jgi:hypothetical protein
MYISPTESRAKGFRLWSETHQPRDSHDAHELSRFDVVAVAGSVGSYAEIPAPERLRAPWLVPGVGNTF